MVCRLATVFLLSLSAALPQPVEQVGPPQGTAPVPRRAPRPGNPDAARPNAEEEKKEPGRLEGQVTNAVTGAPLRRANIMLMPAEPGPDVIPSSTVTDAEGRFAMVDIVPGKYRLSADRTGFVRSEFGARGANRGGTTVTLAPGQVAKQMDFRLQPHSVITGRVFDDEGEPMSNVQVQTMLFRYMQGKRRLMPWGGGSTNDLGEFRIFGLPAGRYYLSATHQNSMMGMGTVDRSASAQPEDGYAATWYPGSTDSSGAVQVQVSAGQPLTGMDIRMRRTKTFRVRGRIANMNPGTRPFIMLMTRDTGGFFGPDRNSTTARGKDGSFEMRGVAPGAYTLLVQTADGQGRQSASVPVDVGTSHVDGIEVVLNPGQDVTGTIRVEGQTEVGAGTIRIYLEPKELSRMGGGQSVSKDDGTFVVRSVAPGVYRVRVTGTQVYLKSVQFGQQEAADGEITIAAGAPPALTVVVSSAGAEVSGTIKGEKDAPAQGVTVVLVPAEASKREQMTLYKVALTDQYGKYSLTAVSPGSYKLFAWDNLEQGQWMDPEFLQSQESKGSSVTLKENSKELLDLAVVKVDAGSDPAAR